MNPTNVLSDQDVARVLAAVPRVVAVYACRPPVEDIEFYVEMRPWDVHAPGEAHRALATAFAYSGRTWAVIPA